MRSERDTEIEWITRLRTERDDYRRQLEALQAQIIASERAADYRATKEQQIEAIRRAFDSLTLAGATDLSDYRDRCIAAGEEIARIKAEP